MRLPAWSKLSIVQGGSSQASWQGLAHVALDAGVWLQSKAAYWKNPDEKSHRREGQVFPMTRVPEVVTSPSKERVSPRSGWSTSTDPSSPKKTTSPARSAS